MIILTKLILAHIIGDFILQPSSWVKDKNEKKLYSSRIYIHILVHAILMFVLLWDIKMWPMITILVITHFLIDIAKIYFQSDSSEYRKPFLSPTTWFFLDQALHIIAIFTAVYFFVDTGWDFNAIFNNNFWLLLTFILFITFASSIIIRVTMHKWTEELTKNSNDDSLNKAGTYIGILERLFIFVFVLSGNWASIGLLLTAKSVFRFGDLRESDDRRLTEYMLIGTLISFGIAIFSAMLYEKIRMAG